MRRSFCAVLFVLCLLLLLNSGPRAENLFQSVPSSPSPVGSGARAMGTGGAFIAIADDATAASWNPAGLIQLERPELSVVGAYINNTDDFSSETHPEISNKGSIDELNLNYASAAYPFRLLGRNMVVSLNYQRLFEFRRDFSYTYDYSSEGLDLIQDKHFSQDGFLSALGLASAVQITPRLSLGATLNIWTDKLFWDNGWKETFSEQGTGTVGGVHMTTTTQITDEYSGFSGINANFGLLWDINRYLTAGAVVKTPFEADIHHEFTNTTDSSTTVISEDVTLDMPLTYGLGFALRLSDSLTFALDVYRTDWSDYILTDSDGDQFSPVDGRPESDSNVKDTTHVRLGGEYLFIGEKTVVPLRGGVFYDPEPSEGSPNNFYGIAAGTGLVYKSLVFDMAYQLRWVRDQDTGNLIATSRADITQHLLMASAILHF